MILTCNWLIRIVGLF